MKKEKINKKKKKMIDMALFESDNEKKIIMDTDVIWARRVDE